MPSTIRLLYSHRRCFRTIIATCALLGIGTSSYAEHSAQHLTKWGVLVLDRVTEETETTPAKWSTVWCDGSSTKNLEGIVFGTTDTLYRSTVRTTKDSSSCNNGAYPFFYEVDQLIAEPVDGTAPKTLLGQGALAIARSAMRMHLASCHEFISRKDNLQANQTYEHTHLSLLSLYGRYAGIEEIVESRGYGQDKAIVLFDRGPHTIHSYGLSRNDKRLLIQSELESARKEFLKMDYFKGKTIKLSQLTNYVLIPAGGGAAAEFAIPENDLSPSVVHTVRVPIKRDLLTWYDHLRHLFIKEHPTLLEWDKLPFYTVAPDASAVVFERDGQLYWQSAGTGSTARPIASLHDVRGWQWHNERYLKPAERKTLSID
jgi:hypothetical protein